MARSIQLMGDTGTNFNSTSDSVRADSFYGFTDGLHTVAIYMNNFTGRFFIEGTLATTPTADDWFTINIGNNVLIIWRLLLIQVLKPRLSKEILYT